MRVRLLQSFLVVGTLSLAGSASAHFNLLEPKPSSTSTNGGKGPRPCGPDDSSAVITAVTGGSMLTIKLNETVPHPGFYRVALALNSRDELDPSKGGLQENIVKDKDGNVLTPVTGPGQSATAEYQTTPVFPVLADNLFPHTNGGGMFEGAVAIPNVNCDKCTLQIIEFMAEHGPDYFYRHCADLKITADPAKPLFDPEGGGGGTGGAGGSGGSAGAGGTSAGAATGGAPSAGSAGTPSAGAPSGGGGASAGTATTAAGTGTTSGGTGTTPTAPTAADDGGCSIARIPAREGTALSLLTGLLIGLGWFARRRNRPE